MSKSRSNITFQPFDYVDWHEHTFVKSLGNQDQVHHVDIVEKNRKADKDYSTKNKSRDYFAKEENEADPRYSSLITHSEIASLEGMRVFHPANPKIRHGIVTDDEGKVIKSVVLSRGVEKFRTLAQAVEEEGGIAKTVARINKNQIFKDLGVTMALSIIHKDTDLHMRNIGEDRNHVAVRIDGDWCNARLRLRTANYSQASNNTFNITPQLIESLPALSNYQPYNWFDQVKGSENSTSYPFIQGLNQEKLRRDIFKTFLAALITPNEYINKVNSHQCYVKEDADSINLEHMTNKLELLTATLQSPAFIKYLQSPEADQDCRNLINQLESHRLALKHDLVDNPLRMHDELELRLQELREISHVQSHTKEWKTKLIDAVEIDVNLRNLFDETALMIVAQDGNHIAFDALVAKGADILAKNDDNESALVYAAKYNKHVIFTKLMEKIDQFPDKQQQLDKALLAAAANDNTYIVQTLLESGANFKARLPNTSQSPLHIAASHGNKANMKLLLAAGAKLSETTAYDETPLILAAHNAQADTVQFILSTGEATKKDIAVALLYAAHSDSGKCIEHLVKAGADLRTKEVNGKTALFIAAEANNKNALNELLKYKKVDISALNADKYNAFTIATRHNNKEAVDLLLKYSDPAAHAVLANQPNYQGDNALAKAIKLEHVDMVKKLLTIPGIDVYAKNKDGESAFDLALNSSNLNILQKFIDAGLDINDTFDNESKDTLLHSYAKANNSDGVDFCLMNKADINAVNADEKTALMIATTNSNTHIMSHLLQVMGIDTEIKDKDGNTALMLAVLNNDHYAVDTLLDGGASTSPENNKDQTALLMALDLQHHECTVELLEAGAELEDIDDVDEDKLDTFIQYALLYEKYDAMFQLLNSCGQLDKDLINGTGMTLMDIASLGDHDRLVEKIKKSTSSTKEYGSSASQIFDQLGAKPSKQPQAPAEIKKPATENQDQASLVMSPRANQPSDMDSPKNIGPKKH